MSTMTPAPKDSPLMRAWEAYKATEDYANTRRWALYEAHVEGSLWAAFVQGWCAVAPEKPPAPDLVGELVKALERMLTTHGCSTLDRLDGSFCRDCHEAREVLAKAARGPGRRGGTVKRGKGGDSVEAIKAVWMEGYRRGRADELRARPSVVKIDPADVARVYEHGVCGNPDCPACGEAPR